MLTNDVVNSEQLGPDLCLTWTKTPKSDFSILWHSSKIQWLEPLLAGILDSSDNCRTVSNADQSDSDGDGVGNACDNCADVGHTDQTDTDQNGVGDACDIPGGSNQDE